MSLVMLLVMSAATYRIARFMVLDTLIQDPREKFVDWLAGHPNRWTLKLQELVTCPYCITIWVSAAVCGLVELFGHLTWWPLQWLATAAGALVFWEYIDSEPEK